MIRLQIALTTLMTCVILFPSTSVAEKSSDVLQPPTEIPQFVMLKIEAAHLSITSMVPEGPYVPTEETYTAHIPVIIEEDGVPKTEMRQELRTRVVLKPSSYGPDSVQHPLRGYRFETAGGEKLSEDDSRQRLKQELPGLVLKSGKHLPKFFRSVLKPDTIIAVPTDKEVPITR